MCVSVLAVLRCAFQFPTRFRSRRRPRFTIYNTPQCVWIAGRLRYWCSVGLQFVYTPACGFYVSNTAGYPPTTAWPRFRFYLLHVLSYTFTHYPFVFALNLRLHFADGSDCSFPFSPTCTTLACTHTLYTFLPCLSLSPWDPGYRRGRTQRAGLLPYRRETLHGGASQTPFLLPAYRWLRAEG